MINIRASLLAVFILLITTPAGADTPAQPPVVRGCASDEERWAASGCGAEEGMWDRGSTAIKSAEREIRAAREAMGGVDPSWDYALKHHQDLITREEARITKARAHLAVVEPQLARCRAYVLRTSDERANHLTAFRSDVKNWQVLYSARMCWFREERTTAIDAIREEHKYARAGGVLNLRLLHEQQSDVAHADVGLAAARKGLVLTRRPPLACSNKIVAALQGCLRSVAHAYVGHDYGPLTTDGVCTVETNPCRLPPLADYAALEE